MITSLLSNVHILQMEDISAEDLLTILQYAAGKYDGLKVAFVCDNAPIPKRDTLVKELSGYVDLNVFDKVQPNPQTVDIQAMADDTNFSGTDVVVAIGGGSVMDSAKALAMLAVNGGKLEDYLGNSPACKIEKKSLPLIAIPTTAGTGSEVTRVGVYTAGSGRKFTLGSPLMHAHTALLCGSFIDSIPPSLCASTGLDALDHALESIWNKNATPITRHAAEEAAIAVLTTLPKLYRAIVNKQADRRQLQKDMLTASCMSGIAFSITGTASGHAISFVLSEDWHVPHGTACAFTLPEVFDWACTDSNTVKSLARIEKHFHPEESDEKKLVSMLRQTVVSLIEEMNIPQKFSDLKIEISENELDEKFERTFSDPKMHNQIPALTKESLHEILKGKI